LTCPACNAPLEIQPAQSLARCAYCGQTFAVSQPVPPARSPASFPSPGMNPLDQRLPDPSLSEVAVLLDASKRVQATIRYREITGATLKEARLALDAYLAGGALHRPNLMNRRS
jgi:hypothetical protein